MNVNTKPDLLTGKPWQTVKGELIRDYGSVSAVAGKLGCHPNAIRLALDDRAPKVRGKLVRLLTRDAARREKQLAAA